jgi:hypothetical protein
MARHIDPRALTGGIVRKDLAFSLATESDEPDVRRLLRENRLGGRYQLTLEREPNAFRADFEMAIFQAFIIARSRETGEPVGLCEKVVWPAYVNGKLEQLPYIGALRVSEKYRNRITVLKGGFEALRMLARHDGELPYALTSITSDNALARRILTANLPGLPAYHPVGEFSTFAMRARRAPADAAVSAGSDADFPEIAAFLCKHNSAYQFSYKWTEASLRGLGAFGLRPEHFLLYRTDGKLRGCLAVWDQRANRQTVMRAYPPVLSRLRPLGNFVAPLIGMPRLPKIGEAVNQAMLSHLAVENDDAEVFRALLSASLCQARARGFDAASMGLASSRLLRDTLLKHTRAIEYRTSLYLAHWPDGAAAVADLKPMTPHPEMALL